MLKRLSTGARDNVQYIYPNVQDLFYIDTALEMGCGTGWLCNSIAYYYGVNITGVDFNQTAIDRASKAANALGVDITFECDDLFQYECATETW